MDKDEAIRRAMKEEHFGYKSPIDVIISEWEMEIENEICNAVQRVGVNVDREELVKALNYDRHQYEKGYADAVRDHKRQSGHWKMIFHDGNFKWIQCSECGHDTKILKCLPNFCEECGAEMR